MSSSNEADAKRLADICNSMRGRTRWQGGVERVDEFFVRLLGVARVRAEEAEASANKWRDECVVEARLHAAKIKRAEEAEAKLAELQGAMMAQEMKVHDQRELIFALREGIGDVDLWETLVGRCNDCAAKLADRDTELASIRRHLGGHRDSQLDGANGLAQATFSALRRAEARVSELEEQLERARFACSEQGQLEARVSSLEGEVERLREAAEDVAEALEIAEHDGDGPEAGLFAEFADALRDALKAQEVRGE